MRGDGEGGGDAGPMQEVDKPLSLSNGAMRVHRAQRVLERAIIIIHDMGSKGVVRTRVAGASTIGDRTFGRKRTFFSGDHY